MKNFWFDSIYFYAFDIAGAFNYLFILIFAIRRWGFQRNVSARSSAFCLMALNGMITSVFDIVGCYVDTVSNFPVSGMSEGTYLFLGWSSNLLYLAFHNAAVALFFLYILIITGRIRHGEAKKEFFVFVPYLVSLCFLIIGCFNGIIFTFDLKQGYRHGPFMPVLYIVSIGYLFAAFFMIVTSQKVLMPLERLSAMLLWFGTILSVILQAFSNGILIELFVQSLMLFTSLISLETREASFMQEVSCFTGQAFSNYTKRLIYEGRNEDLVIVRLNGLDYYARFTSLKDQESARREFAGLIRKAFSVEDVFECSEGTFGFYVEPFTDEAFDSYCDSLIKEYGLWQRHERLEPMIARLRVPENAPTEESVWAFTRSDFKPDQEKKYIVSKESVLSIRRKLDVEQALIRGLKNNTIKTVFQPIVDVHDKVIGAEALSRMNDPVLGYVPPYEFITTAESDGLIWQLGLHSIEDACKILSRPETHDIETIDVNLSVVQCLHGGCRKAFLDILERYGVNPNRINLEITESAFIEDNEIFIREKDDLKEAGFCFSIDDYGSGFSNYQYVRMVGPTVVKLDRGTLLDAEKGEEQRTLVHNAGCDFIQGFYYSKPLGSEEFLKYIEKE